MEHGFTNMHFYIACTKKQKQKQKQKQKYRATAKHGWSWKQGVMNGRYSR